jgi:hypothetical protein
MAARSDRSDGAFRSFGNSVAPTVLVILPIRHVTSLGRASSYWPVQLAGGVYVRLQGTRLRLRQAKYTLLYSGWLYYCTARLL